MAAYMNNNIVQQTNKLNQNKHTHNNTEPNNYILIREIKWLKK